MDNDNREDVMKRKSTASTTFKTDVSSDGNNSCNNKTQFGIDSFDNDIVIRFASYLSPRDMVSLSLTCRRFGGSINADGLSLMEDTARQFVCNADKEERDALPKKANQSYIKVYNKLLKYRDYHRKPWASGRSKSWWHKKAMKRMTGMDVIQFTEVGGRIQRTHKVFRYTDETKTDVELQDP